MIGLQLAEMNSKGYMTINSQPAVDGARSDDKIHGWGPKDGTLTIVMPGLSRELVDQIVVSAMALSEKLRKQRKRNAANN